MAGIFFKGGNNMPKKRRVVALYAVHVPFARYRLLKQMAMKEELTFNQFINAILKAFIESRKEENNAAYSGQNGRPAAEQN